MNGIMKLALTGSSASTYDEREDERDGETTFKRAIHAPGAESFITVAEVARLRAVELELLRLRPVAVELAQLVSSMSGGRAAVRIHIACAHARAVGLLPEGTK